MTNILALPRKQSNSWNNRSSKRKSLQDIADSHPAANNEPQRKEETCTLLQPAIPSSQVCCHPSPLRASRTSHGGAPTQEGTGQSKASSTDTRGHLLQLSPLPGIEMWQHLSTPSPSSSSPGSFLHPTSRAGVHLSALHSRLLCSDLLHHPSAPSRCTQQHQTQGDHKHMHPCPHHLLPWSTTQHTPSQQLMRHCLNKHILKIIIPRDLVCITQESGLAQLQSRGQSKKCMESVN